MSIIDIPVFGLLKQKLNWHQTRQKLLSENVANADTPGYVPLDLKQLEAGPRMNKVAAVATLTTNQAHIVSALAGTSDFEVDETAGWETTPSENAVVLEEQMIKVTENQMDYQTATSLYSRGLSLLRTAVRSA